MLKSIQNWPTGVSLEDFLDMIVPYQGRWQSLVITLQDVSVCEFKFVKNRLEAVQPTKLEQLRIVYGEYLGIDEIGAGWGPQMEILSKARLPQLSCLECVNCIPQPFIQATITELDIGFGSFTSDFQGWDLTPFFDFLLSSASLTNLSVTFTCDKPSVGPYETIAPPNTFPQVTHLQLSMQNIWTPTLESFLGAVKFPGLRALTIRVNLIPAEYHSDYYYDEDGEELLYMEQVEQEHVSLQSCLQTVLTFATTCFPELSKLTVVSGGHNENYTIPFQYVPNLHHLEIYDSASPSYVYSLKHRIPHRA